MLNGFPQYRTQIRAPRSWADKVYPNLIYWSEVDKGRHFAAFEQPALSRRNCVPAFANCAEQSKP
jgi:hypothetical protein